MAEQKLSVELNSKIQGFLSTWEENQHVWDFLFQLAKGEAVLFKAGSQKLCISFSLHTGKMFASHNLEMIVSLES